MRIVTQVLDSTYGESAVGVRARLSRATEDGWTTVAEAETSGDGCIDGWDKWRMERGLYRIVFDSDSYFAGIGTASAYPEVIVVFRMRTTHTHSRCRSRLPRIRTLRISGRWTTIQMCINGSGHGLEMYGS